jgi:hypothetical protein
MPDQEDDVLTGNRPDEVRQSHASNVANSPRSLNVDHVRFVSEQSLEEFVHLSLDTAVSAKILLSTVGTHLGSSSMTLRAYRINMQIAMGFLTTELFPLAPGPNCWTSLVMAILSFSRMRYSRPKAWYCMM